MKPKVVSFKDVKEEEAKAKKLADKAGGKLPQDKTDLSAKTNGFNGKKRGGK